MLGFIFYLSVIWTILTGFTELVKRKERYYQVEKLFASVPVFIESSLAFLCNIFCNLTSVPTLPLKLCLLTYPLTLAKHTGHLQTLTCHPSRMRHCRAPPLYLLKKSQSGSEHVPGTEHAAGTEHEQDYLESQQENNCINISLQEWQMLLPRNTRGS